MLRSSKWFNMTADEYRSAVKSGEIKRLSWDDYGLTRFDFFVVVPWGEMHDSGFAAFGIVAFEYNPEHIAQPVGAFCEYSDVIKFDGIGGYGLWDEEKKQYKPLEAHGWAMDMLPSGLVRFFVNGGYKIIGAGISSFEVWAVQKERGEEA